uniref:Syntaxin 6/10/61 N-terminal domain-containing protein n=1 Tax=Gadus morhua TaxID=8049 RepID=A0A8C5FMK2_GADMO
MSMEDPFFVVKGEVQKAVLSAQGLHLRWGELLRAPGGGASREEAEWTTNELRNSLRSIEWDLEDLDETIGIVESNPKKFNLDAPELAKRKAFISATRKEVQEMKEQMSSPATLSIPDKNNRQGSGRGSGRGPLHQTGPAAADGQQPVHRGAALTAAADGGAAGPAAGAGLRDHRGPEEHVGADRPGAGRAGSVRLDLSPLTLSLPTLSLPSLSLPSLSLLTLSPLTLSLLTLSLLSLSLLTLSLLSLSLLSLSPSHSSPSHSSASHSSASHPSPSLSPPSHSPPSHSSPSQPSPSHS